MEANIQSSKLHQPIVSKLSIDPPSKQNLIHAYLKHIGDKYKVNGYSKPSNNDRIIETLHPMTVPMTHPIQQQKMGFSEPVQVCAPLTAMSFIQTSQAQESL